MTRLFRSEGKVAPAGPGRWFLVLLWTGLASCLTLVGCQGQPAGQGEGPGHRAQQLGLTPQQELELGRQAYHEVLTHPEEYGRALPEDDPKVERTRDIVHRIAKAADIEPLQREINLRMKGYEFEWEVNVLKNPQINAFCLPGGKIAVFTGLLPVTENDAQLATVLSHEISHALAHHASERLAREQKYQQAFTILGNVMGGMDQQGRRDFLGVLAAGAGLRSKAYDRQQESEADHIGLFLMTFAGYDPDQAIRFWNRMKEAGEGKPHPPAIFSDHPTDDQRIRQMEGWVPYAKAAKKAFDEGRVAPAR
ncbi:MAG: M48 family metallopeptidase [Planctomycetes bacterium]|nr:M48 family metallopeptidase [Planctomycetota bacterium]